MISEKCVNTYRNTIMRLKKTSKKTYELRKLRLAMNDDFIEWADRYYSAEEMGPGEHINKRESRQEVTRAFFTEYPAAKRYMNAFMFKKKLKFYCEYRELEFNPTKNGNDDKTGGAEYFTLANKKKYT